MLEHSAGGAEGALVEGDGLDRPGDDALAGLAALQANVAALHNVELNNAQHRDVQLDGGAGVAVAVGVEEGRVAEGRGHGAPLGVVADGVLAEIDAVEAVLEERDLALRERGDEGRWQVHRGGAGAALHADGAGLEALHALAVDLAHVDQ